MSAAMVAANETIIARLPRGWRYSVEQGPPREPSVLLGKQVDPAAVPLIEVRRQAGMERGDRSRAR